MKVKKDFTSWHVGVAAEAFAAGQFARLGFDVSVQYGANQPEYDLIVSKGDMMLKVSVKGSSDGSWGLTQNFCKEANYHSKTIFCFIQFKGVEIDQLPRIYLAHPIEVATQLKASSNGRGDTILYEEHTYTPRAYGHGTTDKIPENWKFKLKRVYDLMGLIA